MQLEFTIDRKLKNKTFIFPKNSNTSIQVKGPVLSANIYIDNKTKFSATQLDIQTPNKPLYLRHLTVLGDALTFTDHSNKNSSFNRYYDLSHNKDSSTPKHFNDFITLEPNNPQKMNTNQSASQDFTWTQSGQFDLFYSDDELKIPLEDNMEINDTTYTHKIEKSTLSQQENN